MTIRAMTLDDLETALGWAADEGWNPGLDDAKAFLEADPKGFLVKELGGEPIAAISVVNHDADFAFLGLYLCKPEYRGQGHGLEIWHAGIAHGGSRNIGLDGVPDQQKNYARSGFKKYGSTIRFAGMADAKPDPHVRPAVPEDVSGLVAFDMKATGIARKAFSSAWLSQSPTRQTTVVGGKSEINGFATFRRCRDGTKIGPFYASTELQARALLASNPFAVAGAPVFIDVQGHDSALAALLTGLGFEPGFETARMFRGEPPRTESVPFQAIATMELG